MSRKTKHQATHTDQSDLPFVTVEVLFTRDEYKRLEAFATVAGCDPETLCRELIRRGTKDLDNDRKIEELMNDIKNRVRSGLQTGAELTKKGLRSLATMAGYLADALEKKEK